MSARQSPHTTVTITRPRRPRMVVVALVAALSLIASGCGVDEVAQTDGSAPPSASGIPGTSRYEIVTVKKPVSEEWVREAGERPEVSADLVARMSDLGVELWQYQRAEQPQANVWVSPVSVYQALSLLAPGVGPQAIDGLQSAMGLASGEIGVNSDQWADWITASRRSDYEMSLYNAAFVAQQYGGFAPGYLEAIEPIRDELGGFDAQDPKGTAEMVNGRVAEHTHRMITRILTPGDITPDLVMILLNTTYFKGTWIDQFDPNLTRTGQFSLLDGSVVEVETMGDWRPLAVTEADGYAAAVLPYVGGATAVIVLPDQGRFDEVAVGLTAADLRTLAGADAAEHTYEVSLPKFTSDSGILELIPALESIGVSRLFTPTPGWPMFGNGDPLRVDFVKHRVVVAVNELGTEAAAATAVGGIGGAVSEHTFLVERPFIMAILDADDTVLFLGQVTDPR